MFNSQNFFRCHNYLFRYSEAVQVPCTMVRPPAEEIAKLAVAPVRKEKNVAKPSAKVNPNLTLRTENEDTCNSDDFSSFYQANRSDSK